MFKHYSMRPFLFTLFLLAMTLPLVSQNYYVAFVKGEVYYRDQLLKKRMKIQLGEELRFTSPTDYVKVSGPGGLHTIRPQAGTEKNNEFFVAIREELFPTERYLSTTAQGMYSVADPYSYFGLRSNITPTPFDHYQLEVGYDLLANGEQIHLVLATGNGLVSKALVPQYNVFFLHSESFMTMDNSSVSSCAIVRVWDEEGWQKALQYHETIEDLKSKLGVYVHPNFEEEVSEKIFTQAEMEERYVGQLLDEFSPMRFIAEKEFAEDILPLVQHSGAKTREEFLWDLFFGEYIMNQYSSNARFHPVLQRAFPFEVTPTMDRSISPRAENPVRMGVIGLVHTHVHWLLGRDNRPDLEIVGIVEPNRELAQRYSKQHGFSMDIVYNTMEEMIEATQPVAVTAFNTIKDHLAVVEYCAPRGIHVMVEKPLAVSLSDARKMEQLANTHGIHLLTNYETSWYGSHAAAYRELHQKQSLGKFKRLVFYTGHPGPIEIGCNPEFVEWLIDPVQNGGGALTDFGCYGANLTTWLLQGEAPTSVYCMTQQLKPQLYPEVDDDATIILSYPQGQVLIQASWNWSHNRKETTLYGTHGYLHVNNGSSYRLQTNEVAGPYTYEEARPLTDHVKDPFAYFTKVIAGEQIVSDWEVSALANNMRVMEILEAAKLSTQTGKVIDFATFLEQQ